MNRYQNIPIIQNSQGVSYYRDNKYNTVMTYKGELSTILISEGTVKKYPYINNIVLIEMRSFYKYLNKLLDINNNEKLSLSFLESKLLNSYNN